MSAVLEKPVIDTEKLALICKVHGIPMEDAVAALEWVSNPTIRPIVGIREFICSPYYMNAPKAVYESIMVELEECNNGQYNEAVFTGSIGSGKTTAALYSLAYQLYILSCYESPHELYGLDPASEIVFIFQSLRKSSAKNDFDRFAEMVKKAPYFIKYFPWDKDLKAELHFPHRIIVKPVSGASTATIGENVFGGMIDEINFMQLITESKQGEADGTYDQAKALYNSIAERRQSRFGMSGRLPGLLCVVSSRRYPGQFTDIKETEAAKQIAEKGYSTIFVYSKRVWEVKEGFPKEKFPVFIGDESRRPRLLTKEEAQDLMVGRDARLVDWIPINFKESFERDIIKALQNIAGHSTLALHPFIVDREAIEKAARKNYVCFTRDRVDFVETQLSIVKSQIIQPELPRWFHFDLAITGDSAGFAMGTVTGFKAVSTVDGVKELLPNIWIDCLLEISPPKNGEIRLAKVRDIIHALRKMGVNIRWGTFDQYQSRDSMQLLAQAGLAVGYQSIDVDTMPYDFVKNALYDGRLSFPEHEKCQRELASLEKNTKKNKIDHPPNGSKDVSDALAGVVIGLTMRREIWAHYGVQAVQLPSQIAQAMDKKAGKDNLKTTTEADRAPARIEMR
jgi:hypothetical protein